MVRTKNMVNYHRVTMGKSAKMAASKSTCSAGGSGGSSSSTASPSCAGSSTPGKNKYSGGNPVHPRETPVWQKEITCFFQLKNEVQRSADDDDVDDVQPMEQDVPQQQTAESSGI